MPENLSSSALNPALQAEQARSQGQRPPDQIEDMGGLALMHNENGEPPADATAWDFGSSHVGVEAPITEWTVDDMEPVPEVPLRKETLDDIEFYTNLPEGIWPFEPTLPNGRPSHPFYRQFLPSAIDTIPVGEFFINRPDKTRALINKNPHVADETWDRKIVVTETPDGKYINTIRTDMIKNAGKNEKLMTALGYEFDLRPGYIASVKAYPTPETIKKKAAKLGVDMKFFPDQTVIASKDYLQAFADGMYPVSTASAEYYMHDTRDDHLTAMVLGGVPLKDALREAASKGLVANKSGQDSAAEGIDEFTATLRATVSPTRITGIRYGDDNLKWVGEKIGISAEKVDKILETARAQAQKYEMELRAA